MEDEQQKQFIEKIASYVRKYASQYGIMVHSPIIAQAVLESAYGTSDKVYKNGEYRHNYFGLKWRNRRCAISNAYFEEFTAEQNQDGTYRNIVSKFMKFNSMEEGVIGYFQWTNTQAYSNLKGVTDPETYLINIKKDKYASSIDYVKNLMNVIRKHNLTKYDTKEVDIVSNSSLVNYTRISPNRTSPREHNIDTITIHCMAGNMSVESCGNVFAAESRRASSNYGIDSDGRIGLYVEEKDRSWCSSNAANDHRAVTIEVANDGGAPEWHISDKAMESLIKLCADICRRNNIKELKWKADKTLVGQVDKQNMTVHRWFAAKSCPGNYIYEKHSYIAAEVNKLLGVSTENKAEESKCPFLVKITVDALNYRQGPAKEYASNGIVYRNQVYTIVEVQGSWGRLKSGAGWINISDSYVRKVV